MHKHKSAWVSATPAQPSLAPGSAGFSLAARLITEHQERINPLTAVIDRQRRNQSLVAHMAHHDAHGVDEDTPMRLADKALYACKSMNRGRYRFAG